jgi:heme exporter protein C
VRQRDASGGRGGGLPWGDGALVGVAGAAMGAAMALIFLWAPTDVNLGVVQRVFYIHVPLAWTAFMAFAVVFVSSIAYLWRGGERWDSLAYAAAEVGVVLGALMLATGSIWAKPVWGVWWTWSPRLTTSLILWLLYVAYLLLRAYAPPGSQGARFAAVLGILGFLNVPIVYFSVEWWRDVHPELVIGPRAEPGALEGSMVVTLLVSLLAFTLFLGLLLSLRYRLRRLEGEVERIPHGGFHGLPALLPFALPAGGPAREAPGEGFLPYLFVAFSITWLVLFGYVAYLARRQADLRREVERLRRSSANPEEKGETPGRRA